MYDAVLSGKSVPIRRSKILLLFSVHKYMNFFQSAEVVHR